MPQGKEMDERDVLCKLPCFEQMAEKYWND